MKNGYKPVAFIESASAMLIDADMVSLYRDPINAFGEVTAQL